MISLDKCNRLLDEGFSLLTVGENKVPNFTWGKNQDVALSKEDFKKRYEYKGGIQKKDGSQLPPTTNVGIITGFDYLECIDVDLKVFSTAKERLDFWNEYLSYLKDSILDFDDKFVIYKTQSNGFHILYKSKRCDKNTKIAKLKGHKEAVIETRGLGGYIFVYENNETNKTYKDVQFISDEDRTILWDISKAYDHVVEPPVKKYKTKKFESTGLTPWEDFNQKNSVLDVISDDFKIVKQLKDRYVIKRHGAKSTHSGYVFKDNGCLFLHSTGLSEIYPIEQQIDASTAYCYKYHNKDFSASAKDLYQQGFGDRIKPDPIIEKEEVIIKEYDLNFPIDVFPDKIQKYLSLCNQTLNSSIDYMGCSLLFVLSIITGNSMVIEVKKGWIETANLWLVLVGKAGIGKTPSINNIVFPLMKQNTREIKKFIKDSAKYEAYRNLDKVDQELSEEVKKPNKTQFIVNDVTMEALIDLHGENKNGIGILRDELAGWFKDMNRYSQGSDLEHWLSSWSGKEINMNRKTAKSSFVERAFIPVLGGIQPDIMDTIYTSENKENGFVDRMLFSFPDLEVEKYNEREMNQEYLDWYHDYIMAMYEVIRGIIKYNSEDQIEPIKCSFSKEAKKEWVRIFNNISEQQNSDIENEYMKSMLPKQKSYIPRFALLLQVLDSYDDETHQTLTNVISKKNILGAEKLSNYFIAMSKKIKVNSIETKDLVKIIDKNSDKSTFDQFKEIYRRNPNINKSKLSDKLGVSRQMIYKYIEKIEQE